MTATDEEWFAAMDSEQLSRSEAEVQEARDRGLQIVVITLTMLCLFLGCLTLWVNNQRKMLIQEVEELRMELKAVEKSSGAKPVPSDRFVFANPRLVRF